MPAVAYQGVSPKAVKWRGTRDIKESPDSPLFEDTASGGKWTRTFNGTFSALMAARPKRLQVLPGYNGFYVDDVRVQKDKGTTGRMTIVLTNAPIQSPDQTEAVLEIEWVEVNKKLETHPRYQTDGEKPLDDNDLDIIEEWKNASTAQERSAVYARIAAEGGYPEAKDFVDKLKRGEDSYNIGAPVVRLTTNHFTKPKTSKCYFREQPPGDAAVPGYKYLKTADRVFRHDRAWQRVQEWTGAESIDEDLYPAAS
jgi:hypothetical protein